MTIRNMGDAIPFNKIARYYDLIYKDKNYDDEVNYIDNLLEETSAPFDRKNWDIDFDMCAPQIIIPEHFFDKEASIMVVDLGKFHLGMNKYC